MNLPEKEEGTGLPLATTEMLDAAKTATHPILGLLEELGIPFEDVKQALEEGGYFEE